MAKPKDEKKQLLNELLDELVDMHSAVVKAGAQRALLELQDGALDKLRKEKNE